MGSNNDESSAWEDFKFSVLGIAFWLALFGVPIALLIAVFG